MSNVCIYVTYHSDESKQSANHLEDYPNLFKFVLLPNDKFFENAIFRYHLDHLDELRDYKCVGHVTYSYQNKGPGYDFEQLASKYLLSGACDFVALRSAKLHKLYTFAETCHPGFLKVWERLIHLLGYGDFRKYPVPYSFYCNYWITKKDTFTKYSGLVVRAMELMDSDPILKELSNLDSGYQGTLKPLSKDKLTALTGHPYYTFHPFVLERLPCFFVTAEKMRVRYIEYDFEPVNTYRKPDSGQLKKQSTRKLL